MFSRFLLSVWLVLSFMGAASAQEGWRFQFTPYLWGTSFSGSITPVRGGPTYNTRLSSGDLLDRVDAAFFLAASARYGRFGFFGDLAFASLSDSGNLVSVGPFSTHASGKLKQLAATVTGGYTVFSHTRIALDILAGARLFHIASSVRSELRRAGQLVRSRTASGQITWADPIAGGRARLQILPRLSVIAQADAGGLEERFSWQALGALNYRATDNFFISVGYRHLSTEVGDGNSSTDVDLGGPLIGATLRF